MPGFVDKAVRIIVSVRHNKSKISSIRSEPMKGGGVFEALHQVRMTWATYVESQSGVMLAESRRSVYG
jgi:hypothetical protein